NFPLGTQRTYSIRVRSTDSGPGNLTTEKVFTVTVSNFAPTDIALSSTTGVSLPNAPVGTLSTADPDVGQAHTYSVLSVNGGANNGQFDINGSALTTGASISLTPGTYSVVIESTDGGLSVQKTFTITLNATDATLSSSTVAAYQ